MKRSSGNQYNGPSEGWSRMMASELDEPGAGNSYYDIDPLRGNSNEYERGDEHYSQPAYSSQDINQEQSSPNSLFLGSSSHLVANRQESSRTPNHAYDPTANNTSTGSPRSVEKSKSTSQIRASNAMSSPETQEKLFFKRSHEPTPSKTPVEKKKDTSPTTKWSLMGSMSRTMSSRV